MLELARIDYDKETKEESIKPLFIYREDISSLYRDSKGVFIINNQGFMYRVPYTLDKLREYLAL